MPNFRAVVLSISVLSNATPEKPEARPSCNALLKLFSVNGVKLVEPVTLRHWFKVETAEAYLEAGMAKGVTVNFNCDGVAEWDMTVDKFLPGNQRNPEPLYIHRPLGKVENLVVETPKRRMLLETKADLAVAQPVAAVEAKPVPKALTTIGAAALLPMPEKATLPAWERALASIGITRKQKQTA